MRREQLITSPRIALAPDYEAYVQGLGKKERHELRRKLRRFEATPGTPAALRNLIVSETERWRKVIKAAGITAESVK